MPPRLNEIIIDGPSLHRIRKGLFLISHDLRREATRDEQAWVVSQTASRLMADTEHRGYSVEPDPQSSAVISVVTPFSAVHTPLRRRRLIHGLAQALRETADTAGAAGLIVMGAGMNPFTPPAEDDVPALCADIHEIEVLDDLEINRIYNLLRQYLPELIAISAHSALHGGKLQKDLSSRMRIHPASFTPPSLALFSRKQLERLQRAVRREYGVGDLSQLDISPVNRDAIVLRFVDAQLSLRFILAQLILFQALAIHGRALARQGSQVPTLHGRIIGENKALAIEGGPGAVFNPDQRRQTKRSSEWYQDRKESERASTALLEALDHQTVEGSSTIATALQVLKAEYDEISPWLLGAELRKCGETCLVNYAEYQVRLFYVHPDRWQAELLNDQQRLFREPTSDLICEYNESKFKARAAGIEETWREKLWKANRAGENGLEQRWHDPCSE